MYEKVIAAISTPLGKGGVAVIRMSGKGSLEIAEKAFIPKSGRRITSYPARMQIYGYVLKDGEKIDDGILTFFPEGGSYTGEETVELSIHGGILISKTVLEGLFSLGAAPAEAGEFTRRAFLNGKISLSEAEAIGSLLEAKSIEQIRLSTKDSRERLGKEIKVIHDGLLELVSSIYARIDYPEEDLGELSEKEISDRLSVIRDRLSRLISTYRTGKAINEGIPAVLCGKPNAGKSSVYNLLLGEDAAIVTDVEGTTRDLLERTVPLGRVLLKLTDTAGIREDAHDPVEKIGINRSKDKILTSELIIAVFDLSRPLDDGDRALIKLLSDAGGEKIFLLNKKDSALYSKEIRKSLEGSGEIIECSALEGSEDLIDLLTKAVDRLFTDEKISASSEAIVASARQNASLTRSKGFIDTALEAFALGLPTDAAASELERALGAIAEVDGRAVSEEIVSDIFSRFCVGK